MNTLRPIILLKIFFLSLPNIERKNFPFLPQFFGRVCQNCDLCVHKNILKQTIFVQKYNFSYLLWFLRDNFLSICWESRWSFQKHILNFHRNTVRKIVPAGKKCDSLSLSAIEQNFSGILSEKFRNFGQNCVPRVQKENFVEKNNFGGNFFLSLADNERKMSAFCKQSFSRVVETAFFASIGKVWGDFFWKVYFFSHPYIQEKKLQVFWPNLRQICWNWVFFSCSSEHFEANELFWEKNLIFIGYWVTNFCHFVEKKTVELKKFVFYESKWKFWGKSYFWRTFFLSFLDIERKNFRIFLGNFSDGFVKTAYFVSIRTFWSKRFSFKNKIFLIFFGFCVTIFCLLVEKVDGIFKSTFYISTGILWGKMLPLEEMWFLIIVGHWAKLFPAFCRKNSESFVKTAFHISKKNILLKKSFGGSFFLSLADNERKTVDFL